MPSVPGPVTNPRSESLAKLPFGWSVTVEVRKKLKRNSFTCGRAERLRVAHDGHLRA